MPVRFLARILATCVLIHGAPAVAADQLKLNLPGSSPAFPDANPNVIVDWEKFVDGSHSNAPPQPYVLGVPLPVDYDKLAETLLDGNQTIDKDALRKILEVMMNRPVYGPITTQNPRYGPPQGWSQSVPWLGSTASPDIPDDVFAIVNRTGGAFEFQVTISGADKLMKLPARGLRTFDCGTECGSGLKVIFKNGKSSVPPPVVAKGGELFGVDYSASSGWTLSKVEETVLSYKLK